MRYVHAIKLTMIMQLLFQDCNLRAQAAMATPRTQTSTHTQGTLPNFAPRLRMSWPDDTISAVAVSANDSLVAVGTKRGNIYVLEASSLRPILTRIAEPPLTADSVRKISTLLKLSRDGIDWATEAIEASGIKKRNISADIFGECTYLNINDNYRTRTDSPQITALSFSNDAGLLAVGSTQPSLRVLDVKTDSVIVTRCLDSGRTFVTSSAFSPNKRWLAVGVFRDGCAGCSHGTYVINTNSWSVTYSHSTSEPTLSVTFSTDGWLFTGSADGNFREWSPEKWATSNPRPIANPAWNEYGTVSMLKAFAVSRDGQVKMAIGQYGDLWKHEGKPTQTYSRIPYNTVLAQIALGPSGRWFLHTYSDSSYSGNDTSTTELAVSLPDRFGRVTVARVPRRPQGTAAGKIYVGVAQVVNRRVNSTALNWTADASTIALSATGRTVVVVVELSSIVVARQTSNR